MSVFYVIDRDLPPGFPVFRYLDFITIVSAEGFGCLPRIDLGIDGIQRIPLSFFRIRRATYDSKHQKNTENGQYRPFHLPPAFLRLSMTAAAPRAANAKTEDTPITEPPQPPDDVPPTFVYFA